MFIVKIRPFLRHRCGNASERTSEREFACLRARARSLSARDWQLYFEEFSGLTRLWMDGFLRHAPSPSALPRLPPRSTIFSLSLSRLLSATTLFWAYETSTLRAGRLGAPFCFIVRSSVRFCAHLPHSLPPALYLIPLCPLYRRSAAPNLPPDRPLTGPPYARALAFSYFLTFSFLQCLKMQK